MRKITYKKIEKFKENMINEEKSSATIEKYMRDVTAFYNTLKSSEFDKKAVLKYKEELSQKYAPASVNSILSSLNSFFEFCDWHELKVKMLKIQRQIFAREEKELTKAEYKRLLNAAKTQRNERLYYLMQTICSCGLRVSEVRHITVEAAKAEKAVINCKGKTRIVLLPQDLCKMLLKYAKQNKITDGAIFITKNGKPLDRSCIWKMMKNLCHLANVSKEKVFPHNLRHLFARTFYAIQKDIVRLADILGHSSVNTTRIYTMETSGVHRKQIQELGLLRA